MSSESTRHRHQQQREQRADRSKERRPPKTIRKVHRAAAASDLNPKPGIIILFYVWANPPPDLFLISDSGKAKQVEQSGRILSRVSELAANQEPQMLNHLCGTFSFLCFAHFLSALSVYTAFLMHLYSLLYVFIDVLVVALPSTLEFQLSSDFDAFKY